MVIALKKKRLVMDFLTKIDTSLQLEGLFCVKLTRIMDLNISETGFKDILEDFKQW